MMEKYLRVIVVGVIVLCAGVGVKAEGVYEAWVAEYNGPENSYDWAYALAIDNEGNVYVTGGSGDVNYNVYDYATIKYAPNGDTLWVRSYNGVATGYGPDHSLFTGLAVDDNGNVYVAGASQGIDDYYPYITTQKYSSTGDTLWIRRYQYSPSRIDGGGFFALVLDDSGNVYVTGSSESPISYAPDFTTIKYSSDGDSLWVARYDGTANGVDEARALAVDKSGYVYVTGWSQGSGSLYDYATIKYAPNGDIQWARRYNGPANSYDFPYDLDVDNDGNVYVTGYSYSSESSFDYATIKYASNGDTLWVRRYTGPENPFAYNIALALAVDNNGNVYVTGESDSGYHDIATIKYSSAGDTVWVRRYDGGGAGWDIAVDGSGNVYVTADSWGDYATIKYSASGDTVWVKRYDGSGAFPYALIVDATGNVYVTGYSQGIGTLDDYVTIKYSPCLLSGEVNQDGKLNIVDIVYLVNILFKSWPIPGPTCLADVNGDSFVSMADIIYLANHVFRFGPAPVQTGPCCD